MKRILNLPIIMLVIILASCNKIRFPEPKNPDTAEKVAIDRFSEAAGTLYVRDSENSFPEANEAIDFDQSPFISKGLGPDGQLAEYYNFDVQALMTAPLYVFFYENENTSVDGQLNIIDVIPGETGYNDFWNMNIVTVPENYEANSITSYEEIIEAGLSVQATNTIINCPVVPEGSTAVKRYKSNESAALHRGWYKGKIVHYFTFVEKDMTVTLPETGSPFVPLSGIMVTFNINPDEVGGGPPSGFVTETGTDQTHNVIQTIPEDDDYSPYWSVGVYDNADFDNVSDWESAINATIKGTAVAFVNCPVVFVSSN